MTDLKEISTRTIGHYEARADAYWAGTHDHDVRQNISALLDAIEGVPPHTVLDFGCGPGRDLKTFSELGHVAIGLDGSTRFAQMARAYSECEVWTQDFLELDLPPGHFDGVFANAVLFHIPTAALPRVLRQLHACLKIGGVLFSSNPRGQNQEGWNGERYGAYYTLDVWQSYVVAAGFTEITHYYRPAGVPPAQQHWLASVWRRAT